MPGDVFPIRFDPRNLASGQHKIEGDGGMADGGFAPDRLRSFIERIERLEQEKFLSQGLFILNKTILWKIRRKSFIDLLREGKFVSDMLILLNAPVS